MIDQSKIPMKHSEISSYDATKYEVFWILLQGSVASARGGHLCIPSFASQTTELQKVVHEHRAEAPVVFRVFHAG